MLHIISFLIYNLKKNSLMEFLHRFVEQADKCPAIVTELAKWLTVLKARYSEVERLFHITLKSPITEIIVLVDSNRDGIITGIKAIVNSFLKSEDGAKREAARRLMVGLTSIRHNRNDQYVEQTGQVDNLLYFLTVQEHEAVETLGLEDIVASLKAVNDRMHALIDERVEEIEQREPGAFADARTAVEEAFRQFVNAVNSWSTLNESRLHENEAEDGSTLSVAQFIKWANASIKFYDLKVLKQPAGEVDSEVEEGDGEESDGKKVTLTFEKADETVIRLTGLTGEAYEIPELLPEHIWVKADVEIEAPTGIFPAGDTTYLEVALGERKAAAFHFLSGKHETFYGLPGTEYTVPEGNWQPEPTGRIPDEDTQYFETLVPEGGSGGSDGSEDSDGSEEKPDTPPAGEEKPKYTVNWINKDGKTVKTMEVEAGTKLTASDYPKASSGYVWKPSWIGGGLTINGDTTIREEPDDDLGV